MPESSDHMSNLAVPPQGEGNSTQHIRHSSHFHQHLPRFLYSLILRHQPQALFPDCWRCFFLGPIPKGEEKAEKVISYVQQRGSKPIHVHTCCGKISFSNIMWGNRNLHHNCLWVWHWVVQSGEKSPKDGTGADCEGGQWTLLTGRSHDYLGTRDIHQERFFKTCHSYWKKEKKKYTMNYQCCWKISLFKYWKYHEIIEFSV